MKRQNVTVVIGPTAAGKTDWAIQRAQEMSGAVISADSRQIYAGMNVGTAKPREAWKSKPHDVLTADTVAGVDHYLFNIRTPDQPMALAEWQQIAFQAIDRVISQNKVPILVGGTMLYVDSIVHNYSIPTVAPSPTLRKELEQRTTEDLYEELLTKDSAAKHFIEPHHKQRIIRALEVITATNKPFSEQRQKQPARYECQLIGLFPGWNELRERIEKRFSAIIDELLEETSSLQKTYGKDLPLLQTMNYKQAAQVLDGTLSSEDMLAEIVKVNMRYARRQMAWWKNRKEITWLS